MTSIDIEPTKTTPRVLFVPERGELEISGESYPENSFEFFAVIKDWLNAHLESRPESFTLRFQLDYFNTSSSKCLLDVLEILERFHKENQSIKVMWYYQEDDEDMEESGHDLCDDLDLEFEFVPVACMKS